MTIAIAKRLDFISYLLLTATIAFLFMTGAPTGDAFSWPDSPRHALNGAFVLDFVRDFPLKHPAAYAYAYYAKYPALTILFYPPFLYLCFALSYALFGVSQTSALFVEFVFYVALAIAVYRIARFWLTEIEALGASLILVCAPEVAYWGRQVMLEIPAFALLTWSAYFFERYVREDCTKWLWWAAALLVLAMYTKLTAAFIAVVYAIELIRRRGAPGVFNFRVIAPAAVAILAVIPLVIITLKFGQANIQSVSGIADEKVSRATIWGWIWYAEKFPSQMGWPALIAAGIGIAAVLFQRRGKDYVFLLLWLVVGYLFFSAIDLKEARHSLALLLPLSIFAAVGVAFLLRSIPILIGPVVVLVGAATLCVTFLWRPVQYVKGYDQVAAYIAQVAPKDGIVAFSGYRDGSFIFAMRTHQERRDLSIVRTDKLLLSLSVRRGLGVKQKMLTESQIAAMFDRLGIQYVVAQPGFWTDLEVMRRLDDVLRSAHFQPIRTFAMNANYNAQEKELIVYRNLGHITQGKVDLNIAIPMIGKVISGTIGKTSEP